MTSCCCCGSFPFCSKTAWIPVVAVVALCCIVVGAAALVFVVNDQW